MTTTTWALFTAFLLVCLSFFMFGFLLGKVNKEREIKEAVIVSIGSLDRYYQKELQKRDNVINFLKRLKWVGKT